MNQSAFPNYTQLPSRLPSALWWFFRGIVLVITFLQVYLLFFKPEVGLVLFWQLLIPLLPLSFAIVPGVWRNICPMALLNQLPRTFGISKEKTLPENLKKVALYTSVITFIIFVLYRHPILNHNGVYLGLVLLSALILALVGGLIYKGRSGWCGTFCPLAPIQKAYGHAPLMLVKNGYCDPCLGCQKNCYDFNPRAAVFSDLNDVDFWWSEKRKFFIALLPGLIVAFFNTNYSAEMTLFQYFLSMLTPMATSVGLFYILHNLLNTGFYKLASLFSMTALSLFYWYGTPVVANGILILFDFPVSEFIVTIFQYSVVVVSLLVFIRGLFSEYQYKKSQLNSAQALIGVGDIGTLQSALSHTQSLVQITEESTGSTLVLKPGKTLLDAIEEAELPIMPGCRMGMCGSDPVVITKGMDGLAPPSEAELTTLRRLGLEGKARLACCCKPKKNISINLKADLSPSSAEENNHNKTFEQNEPINEVEDGRFKIIIIGNGIAGISTAERLREKDSECKITVITKEAYPFYNRMGLEKVLYGRTALQDLYLMKEDWYEENKIDSWLNTQVNRIDTVNKQIILAIGAALKYDKLVLATGASAFVPNQPCYQLPGVFTLRNAEDALNIRTWVQQKKVKRAVILGGGVLGVEAIEALLHIGLHVTIVNTGAYLMNRQLDEISGDILSKFLENKGVNVFINTGIKDIEQYADGKQVLLGNGEILKTDIVLLCIGIRADIALAKTANLKTNRGIIVDEQMRTSDPDIFCVGDVAELPDAIGGLWAIGNDQGKVAANVLLGGDDYYSTQSLPTVQLKLTGIDLRSFGSLKKSEDGYAINKYGSFTGGIIRWSYVVSQKGILVGGVFVNTPMVANAVINASKQTDNALTSEQLQALFLIDEKVIKRKKIW
jgi:NADPH-dependent 2,4-dienoyl-CoA reductase/sulfur reductase-like enzyme/ferredoxin